jgi:site-specific recombinase XerD
MLSQIADFVNWVRRRNPQARTWRDYSYDLRQFAALVGDRPPGEITFREVDRFVNSQVSRGFKPATVNRRLAAILAFFTYLADEDPSLVCPVLPRRHFLRAPQRLPRPVKEDDLEKFFAVISDRRDRAMFILMLRCGLRIGEVANLLRSDLYLDEPAPRLELAPETGKESRSLEEAQRTQLLALAEQLSTPELSDELRLEIVVQMRRLLNGDSAARHEPQSEACERSEWIPPPCSAALLDAEIA